METSAVSACSAVNTLIVGTRGSALAQWQTRFVIAALKRLAPEMEIELRIIKTAGDQDQARPPGGSGGAQAPLVPPAEIGGVGVFTKELENALLAREIDLAVHSLKDLPIADVPEFNSGTSGEFNSGTSARLAIAAVLEREDARDCLVSRHGLGLRQLPRGARVGTSSARRSAQLLALRPDLQIVPLRGNVDTRLRKAQSHEYDAVVLAAAGLIRLERTTEITEYLSFDVMLPDPGQGALAVEIRADDAALASLLAQINHPPTRAATTAERAFLRALGGGCRMPIGAYAEVRGDEWRERGLRGASAPLVSRGLGGQVGQVANLSHGQLHLRGLVASADGSRIVRGEIVGDAARAEELGAQLAVKLLRTGPWSLVLGHCPDVPELNSGTSGARTTTTQRKSKNLGARPGVALRDTGGGLCGKTTPGHQEQPLRGRKILITRAREGAQALAERIRALGGEPIEFPTIDFAPLDDFRELDNALARVRQFDWVIFTSANGVRAVAERLRTLGLLMSRSPDVPELNSGTSGHQEGLKAALQIDTRGAP
ncbi:MAG: hydroxymethylbilane synthase, partial [Chloroflexota bacterium]